MAELCSICGNLQEDHDDMNHEFNTRGELITKNRSTPPKTTMKPRPTVVGAIDFELRQVLFEKGLISNADFAALHDPGARASGDHEAGEAPSSG